MTRAIVVPLAALMLTCGVSPKSPDPVVGPIPGLVVPSSFHLLRARPLTLYGPGLLEVRDPISLAISVVGQSDAGAPFSAAVAATVDLDGSQLSGAGFVVAKPLSDSTTVFKQPVTYFSSPVTKAGSPKILVIGDSLSYRGTVSAMAGKLAAGGVTPTYLGTLQESGGVWCEGRPSWEFSDFTRKALVVNPDGSAPTYPIDAAGGDGVVATVAQYLALGSSGNYGPRWQYNPFIRPEAVGDDPALVRNGYVFDVRFYLNRFGMPDPDIVMIALGTNDTASNPQIVGNANAIDGLTIIYEQTRVALPNAQIAVIVNGFPSAQLWAKHLPFVKYVLGAYSYREAQGVFVLPAYAVVDPTTVPDWVHPDATGMAQWAEMTFAFVMNQQ